MPFSYLVLRIIILISYYKRIYPEVKRHDINKKAGMLPAAGCVSIFFGRLNAGKTKNAGSGPDAPRSLLLYSSKKSNIPK